MLRNGSGKSARTSTESGACFNPSKAPAPCGAFAPADVSRRAGEQSLAILLPNLVDGVWKEIDRAFFSIDLLRKEVFLCRSSSGCKEVASGSGHPKSRGADRVLNVESELDDVAVLHDVFLAFDAEFAGFAGFGVGTDGVDRWLYVTHCAHMTTITIRELHMKTGQWVRAAARGKRGLLVLDRGRPAARLLPPEDSAGVDFSERKLVRGFDRLPELSVDSARLLEEDRR